MDAKSLWKAALPFCLMALAITSSAQDRSGRRPERNKTVIIFGENGVTLNGNTIARLPDSSFDKIMERIESMPDNRKSTPDRFSLPDMKTPLLESLERLRRELMPESSTRARPGMRLGDDEGGRGVRVLHVEPASPAEKAGLQKGDLVIMIADAKVRNTEEARTRLRESRTSEELKVTVKRNRKPVELTLDLSIPSPYVKEI